MAEPNAVIPPPPPGFTLDDVPPPPPGFVLDRPKGRLQRFDEAAGDVARKAVTGLGEGVLSLATGAVAAPVAGLAGIGQGVVNMVAGDEGSTPAGERVGRVQQALTYQPRSAEGELVTDIASAPFEKLAEGADTAGEATARVLHSPAAGAAVNTAIQSIPAVLGKVAGPKVRRAVARDEAVQEAAQKLSMPQDEVLRIAKENKIAVSPSQGGGGAIGTTVEGLAGEPKLQKTLSKANAPRINMLVRRDLGMAEDEPLTRENFARIRKDASEAYQAIKDIGEVPTDAVYKQDLSNVVQSYDTAAKSFSHRSENPFSKVMDGLNVDKFDSASAIEEVKLLRQDADSAYADRKPALGRAYKDAAAAVDNMLDRHLTNLVMTGADPSVVEAVGKYRAARQRIAKTYTAEKALNPTTGNINAAVYARELQRGKPLSGEGEKVAKIAQAFPRAVQQIEKAGSTGPTIFDLAPAVMGKEALLVGARPVARHIIASEPYQSLFTRGPDYSPNFALRLSDLLTDDASVGAAAAMQGAQQRK